MIGTRTLPGRLDLRRRAFRSLAVAVLLSGCTGNSGTTAERASVSPVAAVPPGSSSPPAPVSSATLEDAPPKTEAQFREVFPHVRVDLANRVVEFDGTVPINAHDDGAPVVYLEVAVCTTDTKEHEALVVTAARPSNIHAALLLIGLEPGSPGTWKYENDRLVPIAPSGPELEVRFAFRDEHGEEVVVRPADWIANAANGEAFDAVHGNEPGPRWVFAGSQIIKRRTGEVYDADGAGTLVGLTTFGSETVAWSRVISPEAGVQEPEWIAKAAAMPRVGTEVRVRLSPALSGAP